MFDCVILGGTVVTPREVLRRDIAVSGERIVAVVNPGELESSESARYIDATGQYLLPGLVDAHVHIPGYLMSTRLEDFASATRAAAMGGVTTVMLMPTDEPRIASANGFEQKKALGSSQSHVDFAIQALVGPDTKRSDIEVMTTQGVISFELFLAYGGNPDFVIGHDDYELKRLLQLISEIGSVAAVTPHSLSLITKLTAIQKAVEPDTALSDSLQRRRQQSPVATFAATRPVLSELLGLARACTVAAETRTRLHLRALSSRRSIDLVTSLRGSLEVSSEVMSHHLVFSDEDVNELGPYGIIIPPIRSTSDRDALRHAVKAAQIEMVVSDHSPVLREDKDLGWSDIWKTSPGMPGVQTLLLAMLTLVDGGLLSLSDVVRAGAEAPARAFGLYPRKGCLQPGADADIVVLEPHRSTLISDDAQKSRAGYTTLKGRTVQSSIALVLLRGRQIVKDGCVTAEPTGRFVHP